MRKKILFVLVLIVLFSGSVVFGQNSKHKSGDMLLGIDLGMGLTPSFFSAVSASDEISKGNYAITFDLGLNFDYYLFDWLSFNSGLFTHSGIYLLCDKPLPVDNDITLTDWAKTPICFTIPVMAHINVPVVEWLYLGAGVTLNFPTSSMLDTELVGIDTKGKFFLGIPLDFGFDSVKPGKGGSRFFFRVTPEIHSGGTPVLVGFMWQVYNFKIYSKKS